MTDTKTDVVRLVVQRVTLHPDAKRARLAAGLSQAEVSESMGKRYSQYVSAWEHGIQQMSVADAVRYAEALGLTIEFVAPDDDDVAVA